MVMPAVMSHLRIKPVGQGNIHENKDDIALCEALLHYL
jgi:hypothetical protein